MRIRQERKTGLRRAMTVVVAAAVGFGAAAAGAQAPPGPVPAPESPTGGGPNTDSLDPQVERELFGADPGAPQPKRPPASDPASTRRVDAWNDLLERELGQAAVDEVQNPLLGIARSMRLAEGLIDDNESGEKTQQIQGEIVADIDALLKRAQKKCQSCASPSQSASRRQRPEQPDPSKPKEGDPDPKPATTGGTPSGKTEGQAPDMAKMLAVIKQVWGELPEQERQRMLQSSIEEFLPKYADMIEQYYKRLAEDRKEPR
ncbi:MAG: hypothetical protein ACYC6Y_17790 [Thermoguttaceae bacterium]